MGLFVIGIYMGLFMSVIYGVICECYILGCL